MLPVGMSIKIGEERIDPVDGLMYVYNGKSWKALIEIAIEELPEVITPDITAEEFELQGKVIVPEEVITPPTKAIKVPKSDVKIKDIKK